MISHWKSLFFFLFWLRLSLGPGLGLGLKEIDFWELLQKRLPQSDQWFQRNHRFRASSPTGVGCNIGSFDLPLYTAYPCGARSTIVAITPQPLLWSSWSFLLWSCHLNAFQLFRKSLFSFGVLAMQFSFRYRSLLTLLSLLLIIFLRCQQWIAIRKSKIQIQLDDLPLEILISFFHFD